MPEAVTSLPIRTATIPLEEIGYAGWAVDTRLNVRAKTYDDFLSADQERFWSAVQTIVVHWNLLDEDGQPLPLPKDGLGARDLPIDILNTLVLRYVEAMAESAAVPKAREPSSAVTSRTNGVDPSTARG